MRPSAVGPILAALVAAVLAVLCLVAGHKPGFMEDYHVVTVSLNPPSYPL